MEIFPVIGTVREKMNDEVNLSTDKIELSAYEKHYSLITHYSGLLHKGRIAFISLSLLVWAYVLGIRPSGLTYTIDFLDVSIPGVASIAYVSSIFTMMLSLMEIAYYKRYFSVVQSGIFHEKNLNIVGYFRGFKSSLLWSFLSLNLAVSVGLFLVAAWLWLPIFKIFTVKSILTNILLLVIWSWPTKSLLCSAKSLVNQQKGIAEENKNTEHSF